ncbi:MAG: cyclase family protein [Dermatophilaceae bacterium]
MRGDYRITVADFRACLERQRVRGVGTGDIPISHTGWTHLARSAREDHLAAEPGIHLAEARYFARQRFVAIASDTWGLEVVGREVTGGNQFPCHQELLASMDPDRSAVRRRPPWPLGSCRPGRGLRWCCPPGGPGGNRHRPQRSPSGGGRRPLGDGR